MLHMLSLVLYIYFLVILDEGRGQIQELSLLLIALKIVSLEVL